MAGKKGSGHGLKCSGYSSEKAGQAESTDTRRSASRADIALLPTSLDADEQADGKCHAKALENFHMVHGMTISPPSRRKPNGANI